MPPRVSSIVAAALAALAWGASARAQWHTPWEQNPGSEGIVRFPTPMSGNGSVADYAFGVTPAPLDPSWGPAPDARRIEFTIRSTLCDANVECAAGVEFTYFRTTVCVPTPTTVGSLVIGIERLDDGARVTVINSRFPSGTVPTNGYAMLGARAFTSSNLVPLLVAGERNTILVTHVDDCCSESYLVGGMLMADGSEMPLGVVSERCNGLDDDCNGQVDDGFGETTCGIGDCLRTVQNCENGRLQTCVPGAPVPEVCDGRDNDCNGPPDDGLGMTSCGVGACMNIVPNCVRGRPVACLPGPPREEVCNGRDDDCNGIVDDDCRDAGPEPVLDAGEDVALDGTLPRQCGGDPRCDRSLRLAGRAGPWGCACSAPGGRKTHAGESGLLIAAIAVVLSRRVKATALRASPLHHGREYAAVPGRGILAP